MPMAFRTLLAISTLILPPTVGSLSAQGSPDDRTVQAEEREAVIGRILTLLTERYVFPDTASAMVEAIRTRQARGDYDGITSGRRLADSLTAHLRAVSRDLHLRVQHSVEVLSQPADGDDGPTPDDRERAQRRARQLNYGLEKVERLAGNVGYLEIRSFGFGGDGVAEAAAAAFTFLKNVDALIIDVRRNGGGSPAMVALVSSYLFGPEPVHLNSLYSRPEDRTRDFYTMATVRGVRFGPDRPLYVLTSRRTFSAAEEFTYNLQSRGRAVIVGDTTGGGAHPGGPVRVSDHFSVWIPTGRAINPITGTNWERVGVRPDLPVPSDDALKAAHLAALRALRNAESNPEFRQALGDAIAEVEGTGDPFPHVPPDGPLTARDAPRPSLAEVPSTDIWLGRLVADGRDLHVVDLRNITEREGYDNQPNFSPDGQAIYYTSALDTVQTEIFRYDVASGTTTRVTYTPDANEYSPTFIPGQDAFSTIRGAQGIQHLWRYRSDGSAMGPIFSTAWPVGYHAWAGDSVVAMFILGDPPTLQVGNAMTGAIRVVAENPGRSIHRIPGSDRISYVHKISDDEWFIERMDPATGASDRLTRTLPGREDYAWMADGGILMGDGTTLHLWQPGLGWRPVGDLEGEGRGAISRLAVSSDGRLVAIVMNRKK